jgi:hypothetical protein
VIEGTGVVVHVAVNDLQKELVPQAWGETLKAKIKPFLNSLKIENACFLLKITRVFFFLV